MSHRVGYVVAEYNQASGQPMVLSDVYDTFAEAKDDADLLADIARRIHRGERYAVWELTEIEEDPGT